MAKWQKIYILLLLNLNTVYIWVIILILHAVHFHSTQATHFINLVVAFHLVAVWIISVLPEPECKYSIVYTGDRYRQAKKHLKCPFILISYPAVSPATDVPKLFLVHWSTFLADISSWMIKPGWQGFAALHVFNLLSNLYTFVEDSVYGPPLQVPSFVSSIVLCSEKRKQV